MIDENRILDEIKAIISPFSAYLDNLYLAFTTSSDLYRQQVERGSINPVLTAFYGPEWGDRVWVFDPATGIRRTVVTAVLDVEDAERPYSETTTVEEYFDDWVVKAFEKEKRKVITSIDELVKNPSSPYSTEPKLNYLTDKLHELKSQLIPGSSLYFTARVDAHAKLVLSELEKYIVSKYPPAAEELKPQVVDKFEYQGEGTDSLYDLYDRLQADNRFIDGQKSRPINFVNGFRGRITKPVVWSGTNDELWYFITKILSLKTGEPPEFLIKTNRKRHWHVVKQLFINKFDRPFLDTLKNNNDPSIKSIDAIDSILKLFS